MLVCNLNMGYYCFILNYIITSESQVFTDTKLVPKSILSGIFLIRNKTDQNIRPVNNRDKMNSGFVLSF